MAPAYSSTSSRSRRDFDESVYDEPIGKGTSAYVEPYVTEAGEDDRSYEDYSEPQPQPKTTKSASRAQSPPPAERSEQGSSINNVSPELLAEITERIKKEVVEHLKQASTLDSSLPDHREAAPMQPEASSRSVSTPSPPPTAQKIYTPPSPVQQSQGRRFTASGSPPPLNDQQASPQSPNKAGVRFMNRPRDESVGTHGSRPVAGRTYSTAELSAIDQKWGMLIDHDGKPTIRLGQVLKGLANHIIEDFEPKKTIVITPAKMAEFYSRYSSEKEVYPFISIFKVNAYGPISQLYQELGCHHHLISTDAYKAPTIPGLTPAGFAEWITHWILAYPDAETTRLEKVLLALPIDADGQMVDGKPERLPKQISRYLLPKSENTFLRQNLHDSVSDCLAELGLSGRSKPNTTASPSLPRQGSVHHPQPVKTKPIDIPIPKPIERERMPYVNTPSLGESASIDEPLPVKIERERQPYIAMPGNGKVYNDARTTTTINNSTSGPPRRDRADSGARSDTLPPREKDEGRHARSNSTRTGSYVPPRPGGSRRPPSPKFTSFSQSTPLNLNYDGERRDRERDRERERDHYERYAGNSFTTPSNTFTPDPHTSSSGFLHPVIIDARDRDRGRDGGRDRERDRERDMDRNGMRDYGREHDRSAVRDRDFLQERDDDTRRYPIQGRARRGTMEDTVRPRLPADISTPREAERWDRLQNEDETEDFYRGGRGGDYSRY